MVRETRSQVDSRRGVSTRTDAIGNTTQVISDIFGRTIAKIDALGNRTEMVYNRIGEVVEQRDPMGRVTRFVYDALGRRVEVILPKPSPTEENPVQRTVYDALGRVIQQIDPLGNAITTEYDAFGRRAAVIDAEGGRTEFTYDVRGKMLALKDPVGNVTSYVYDDMGRMLEETNELGKTRRFEYEGQLPIRTTDRNGRTREFEYDDFGRPVAEKWLDVDGKIVETIASQFDALGKLAKVTDSSGVQTFEYDELDNNTQTVFEFAGLQTPVTLHNQFDENKRRTRAMATIGDTVDFVNQYEYDALGKVVGMMQNDKQVAYAYNAAGQRTSMSVFAGTNKVFDTLCQYDDMGRPINLMHAKHKTIFANYDYTWDIANRITGFDFSYLGNKDEKTAEYGYDKTSQLIEADYNAFQPNEAYEYDANGNRMAFETGKNNQLLSDGVFDYKYDDEGNRIEKVSQTGEVTKYVWDHRNRLVQVMMPKETVAYLYDFQNRMTRRNDKFFVHDGWQIVLTLDSEGKVKNRNLWGDNQDELIATNDQFTLYDLLGSVRDIVNADGKVLGHREYNAFGKITRSTGQAECPFGYTGKMFDNATGLQWNINRWYDAEVGRWISEDPIGFGAGDTNLSRYGSNVVILNRDPLGLLINHVLYLEIEAVDYLLLAPDGTTHMVTLNTLAGGSAVPWHWRIGTTTGYHGVGFLVEKMEDGCFQLEFHLRGKVLTLIRPTDHAVVHAPTQATNHLIWAVWFANQGPTIDPPPADFPAYQQMVRNHEKHHFLTLEKAFDIIAAGLKNLEKCCADTEDVATTRGNNARDEAYRIMEAAIAHSEKYDNEYRQLSFTEPYNQPFTENFLVVCDC